ncbi:hypothetical protein [Azotobacter vinelandii]|uniref:hypothetical protein n=1 Tax=Azotobacter vinelandii TaxID=354 RepID=UPI0026656D7E|nr:hypothetical protein [Azotobacter vinelandii]WKN21103.1 hypothetical protein AVAEIV_004164 [Azotobacter vinelandii]
MCLSNKEMDEAVERAEAMTKYAIAHCSDNSAEYVGDRYHYLYGQNCRPVPVRQGTIMPAPGRLFPASIRSQKKGACEWHSARPKPGIIATLLDESTGELGEYLIETNGFNGVEVVGRA